MEIKKANLYFDPKKLARLNPSKVKLIILHHACADNKSIEEIHKMHIKNGWAGIGYHYYIRYDGVVYQGRPTAYVGSHCKGNNSCSIGICFEGDFRKHNPTDAQIKACRELCRMLKKQFRNIYKILNHKDLYATACPVKDLKNMVGQDCVRG